MSLSSVEMCAGAGGQALGLEKAGFGHEALVEIENHFCETLRLNRPKWNVFENDLKWIRQLKTQKYQKSSQHSPKQSSQQVPAKDHAYIPPSFGS